ncbi:hypothetical protein GEMRC1_002039 [Eukaryota sp. GEM-RC1]
MVPLKLIKFLNISQIFTLFSISHSVDSEIFTLNSIKFLNPQFFNDESQCVVKAQPGYIGLSCIVFDDIFREIYDHFSFDTLSITIVKSGDCFVLEVASTTAKLLSFFVQIASLLPNNCYLQGIGGV